MMASTVAKSVSRTLRLLSADPSRNPLRLRARTWMFASAYNYDGWVKLGVQQKVIRCGPKLRPCIRVDESAGQFGSEGDGGCRVIWGC